MRRLLSTLFLLIATSAAAVPGDRATAIDALSDTLYNAFHPRLLFDKDEIPGLYAKVRDGGQDDYAYLFIRNRVDYVYKFLATTDLLENDYGLEEIANLALATYLESPYDTTARDIGKALTLVIADSFEVDNDIYASSLRLRNLALGYDCFFADATVEERARVRDEVASYLTYMTTDINYIIWLYHPYVSNQTAMGSAAIGLAAIGLQNELDPALASAALDLADDYFHAWLDAQLDPQGAYREGLLYGLWSMRHLVYYFEARKRFDGYDYLQFPGIGQMEGWIAYELDPRGLGRVNNLQDCTDFFRPLARHTTYLDWAQSAWGSELAVYLFLHGPGPFGVDMGDNADKAGTVLWAQPLSAAAPESLLPPAKLWTGRGFYYYRTGWPFLFDSDDVVFSFYSGVFQGGHAQEDQNQFTLTAYGEKLVTDHGAGSIARQSEAHNMVFIDGAGQHNAGGSIGTDGVIADYLIGDYIDYLVGDATLAYTTYSPYNENGYPFPTSDWSWGHKGANPVNFALRKVVVVHEAETPPYFIIRDDIEKDGGVHAYEWRLHTQEDNAVDASSNPIHITGDTGSMEVFVVAPCFDSLAASVAYFDNFSEDDNSNLLSLTVNAVNPLFTTILLPRATSASPPAISESDTSGAAVTTIDWGNGYTDVMVAGGVAGCPTPAASVYASGNASAVGSVATDAEIAVLRLYNGAMVRYLMANGTTLWYDGVEWAHLSNGPAGVSQSDAVIYFDRPDADFAIYSPSDLDVYYHKSRISTVRQGDYLLTAATSGAESDVRTPAGLSVRAYPNPFNPDVRVVLSTPAKTPATVDVYDVAGRRVASLWSGTLEPGETTLRWNAASQGASVASGVYFLRVETASGVRTVKLTILK